MEKIKNPIQFPRSTARIFEKWRRLIFQSLVSSSNEWVYLPSVAKAMEDRRPLGLSFDRWRRSTNRTTCWIGDCGQAVFFFFLYFNKFAFLN